MPRKPTATNLPAVSDQKPRFKLAPWQARFAIALAMEASDRALSKQVQCDMATRLANDGRDVALPPASISYDQIKTLKARADFQELVHRTREGGIEAARALFVADMPFYVDLHRWGAQKAREKEALNIIPSFTQPMLRAIAPDETVRTNVNVQINLTPARAELALGERPVIEAEVVAPDAHDEP